MRDPAACCSIPSTAWPTSKPKCCASLHNYSFRGRSFAADSRNSFCRALPLAARGAHPAALRLGQGKQVHRAHFRSAIGHEIAQLAHEDDPLAVVRALEKEEFLKVLHSALDGRQGRYQRPQPVDENPAADCGPGLHRRPLGRGDAFPDGAPSPRRMSPICGGRFLARIWLRPGATSRITPRTWQNG
jgi:hypothetical protein